jgi:crotonobetainyl-CoA:carnitine CoA-transferase CaiB-like acyl-CoA transferase
MGLLSGLKVVQLGEGRAAAVCGRLFADSGAGVRTIGARRASLLDAYFNRGKAAINPQDQSDALAAADLIVAEGSPTTLRSAGWTEHALRVANPAAAIVLISPFGQTGPRADEPATDLTLLYASGIARLLTGQVDDLAEAPIRATGDQSAIIGGLAAACAGMHAVLRAGKPSSIDVSIQEALATLAMTELTRAGQSGRSWQRKRQSDGNGATVCILPAADGYVAISPREQKQWNAWLEVMGSPAWGTDPKFAKKVDRIANWDALHSLMSDWSVRLPKVAIAEMAQDAHVPSFPLREPAEQLASRQLAHREFFEQWPASGATVKVPGPPFRLHFSNSGARRRNSGVPANLPLSGIRVLDFSWVIAGPTATRHLAAMGAEVIKVEAPGSGDPGRTSELHTVLGQAKKAIVLDLKEPEALEVARRLAATSDVLIENFATGVMERLGLGNDELRALNPNLIYVSASGMGRTGPEAGAVAYGTLLQCYAGFAGLNRHPDRPPRVGFAWLDPMCGLMLPFLIAAAVWRQRNGRSGGVRIDFSMVEAMLWSMPGSLLDAQVGKPSTPMGNASHTMAPHGAYRCAGDDHWLAVAASDDAQWRKLCAVIPALSWLEGLDLAGRQLASSEINAALDAWSAARSAAEAANTLTAAGVPAAALADSLDLVASNHLHARSFWDRGEAGVLPGLPWQANFDRQRGPAPALGADTEAVLRETLSLTAEEIAQLRGSGALGQRPT